MGTLAPKRLVLRPNIFKPWANNGAPAPGGGVQLTIYPDGTMGSGPTWCAACAWASCRPRGERPRASRKLSRPVAGLQNHPKAFRTTGGVDYIGEKLQPMLEKRSGSKRLPSCSSGPIPLRPLLLQATHGFARRFRKDQGCLSPPNRPAELESLSLGRCNAVPLEVADICRPRDGIN